MRLKVRVYINQLYITELGGINNNKCYYYKFISFIN